MSARKAKQARRVARAEAGISKDAEREQREFEARVRAKRVATLDRPIERRDRRRQVLAGVALAIVVALILAFVIGAR